MRSSSNLLKIDSGSAGRTEVRSALATGAFPAIYRRTGGDSVDDSLVRARRMLDEARQDAERIVRDAREEAGRLLREARDEAEAIRSEAFRSGYDDGLSKAASDLSSEIEGLVNALRSARDAILAQKRDMMKAAEQELIELALEIASRIIRREIARDSSCVIEVIEDALRHTSGEGMITVRVAETDLERARGALPAFQKLLDGAHDLKILPDPRVEPGGCIVETQFGTVDARPARQFEQIRRSLGDVGGDAGNTPAG
ncbi:MAG TPA: hypothetical protein GX506_10295 [Firmicutes bacterium]|nr:hypothetical protein [Bacillota bacterium]